MFHQMYINDMIHELTKEKWEKHNGAAKKDMIHESVFIYFKKHGEYYGYYAYYQGAVVQKKGRSYNSLRVSAL
jgi:hypothetical protein